jgi:hypothetical protein
MGIKPPEISNGETVEVINIIIGKSSQLMKPPSPCPEKMRQVHSNMKNLLIAFSRSYALQISSPRINFKQTLLH